MRGEEEEEEEEVEASLLFPSRFFRPPSLSLSLFLPFVPSFSRLATRGIKSLGFSLAAIVLMPL